MAPSILTHAQTIKRASIDFQGIKEKSRQKDASNKRGFLLPKGAKKETVT
jgi:hypothetical protein